jgi:hypothetical protein
METRQQSFFRRPAPIRHYYVSCKTRLTTATHEKPKVNPRNPSPSSKNATNPVLTGTCKYIKQQKKDRAPSRNLATTHHLVLCSITLIHSSTSLLWHRARFLGLDFGEVSGELPDELLGRLRVRSPRLRGETGVSGREEQLWFLLRLTGGGEIEGGAWYWSSVICSWAASSASCLLRERVMGRLGVVGGVWCSWVVDDEAEHFVAEPTGESMSLSSLSASLSETMYRWALWSQQGFAFSACLRFSFCLFLSAALM